jgi:hypothetical protein
VADTTGSATLYISPAIVGPGDTRQNVSRLPTTGDAVSVFGASGVTSQYALAYHKNAFVFGTADLDLTDDGVKMARAQVPELGLALRIAKQFDIRSNQNLLRLDLLGGWSPLYNTLACKIATN